MRFGFFTAVCLIGGAIAYPIKSDSEKRDISAINRSNQRISNSINQFITAIRLRPKGGDVNEARRQTNVLLGLANQIVYDSKQGAREIRAGPHVAYLEALSLLGPITNMGNLITTATNGWTDTNVQEMVKVAGMRTNVLRVLRDTSDAMKENGDAIVGKLPVLDGAGTIANQVTHALVSLVDNAIRVYSKFW
jgi:hypothetical protein